MVWHEMNQPLPHPDALHLQAAQGWLELGNGTEAHEELKKISSSLHRHPDVLELQWEICALAGAWNGCVEIADASIKIDPDRVEAWIHRSFALHELKCTREALENLLPAAEKFPEAWTIPYNLACYCTQLGRLDEASEWFRKAMVIDADAVKRAGIDDPDLKPLWDSWGGFAVNR